MWKALGLKIHLSEFSFIFYSCIHMIMTPYRRSVTSIQQLLVAFVVDLYLLGGGYPQGSRGLPVGDVTQVYTRLEPG